MKKLKSGFRFNHELRVALAHTIASTKAGTTASDLEELHAEVSKDIIESYWKASELNTNFKTFSSGNYLNGEFPVVKVLNINSDGVRQQILIDAAAIPFSVYMDQYAAYAELVDDLTKAMADEFIKKNATHQESFTHAKEKLLTFMKDYTSPAKLLEVAPDFEQYFPDSYFEKVEAVAPATSIDDLLAA
jgi:hypothetical protein